MRWIFISLLVFNAAAFCWGWFFESPSATTETQSAKPFAYKHVQSLQLLSELPPASVAGVDAETADQSAKINAVSGSSRQPPIKKNNKPLCALVGPFKDREGAAEFQQRLSAMDIRSNVKDVELPAGLRYQIYLPPEVSQKAALRKLAELQAKKIDSYVIPKGDLENGISLGLYSQKDLADQRLGEVQAIGLPAAIKVIERTYWEIWVMLEEGEGEKMSELAWSRVMDGINSIEKRQNFCLPVASDEKFH